MFIIEKDQFQKSPQFENRAEEHFDSHEEFCLITKKRKMKRKR